MPRTFPSPQDTLFAPGLLQCRKSYEKEKKRWRLKTKSFPVQYQPLPLSSSRLDTQPSTCVSLRGRNSFEETCFSTDLGLRAPTSERVATPRPRGAAGHDLPGWWQQQPKPTLRAVAGSKTSEQGQGCRNTCRRRDPTHAHCFLGAQPARGAGRLDRLPAALLPSGIARQGPPVRAGPG